MSRDLIERLLWHVEQVCGPLSTETCEVAGDDDRSVLAHNLRAELSSLRGEGDDFDGDRRSDWLGKSIERIDRMEEDAETIGRLVGALEVGEQFLNACFSAWSCGEPYHRVKTMTDRADAFRAALDSEPFRQALASIPSTEGSRS